MNKIDKRDLFVQLMKVMAMAGIMFFTVLLFLLLTNNL